MYHYYDTKSKFFWLINIGCLAATNKKFVACRQKNIVDFSLLKHQEANTNLALIPPVFFKI